jgi:hypothetical protein
VTTGIYVCTGVVVGAGAGVVGAGTGVVSCSSYGSAGDGISGVSTGPDEVSLGVVGVLVDPDAGADVDVVGEPDVDVVGFGDVTGGLKTSGALGAARSSSPEALVYTTTATIISTTSTAKIKR